MVFVELYIFGMLKDESYFREKLKRIKGTDVNFGGWITSRDRRFLVEFLQLIDIKNPTLVEIGTFMGGTATIFLTILDDCKLIAIDNWSEGPYEPFASLKEAFEHHMRCFIEQGRVEVIDGDSRDIGRNWNRPIDLLYIDGDHSYEVCSADIRNFTPWVRRGGYVFVDDYDVPAVRRAVDELLLNNPDYLLMRMPQIDKPSPEDEKLIVFKRDQGEVTAH
mgnify:CR=1 FL=1